eukprot:COSAG01_NODE_573_length_15298_cov_13.922394_6_plen_186_part_00
MPIVAPGAACTCPASQALAAGLLRPRQGGTAAAYVLAPAAAVRGQGSSQQERRRPARSASLSHSEAGCWKSRTKWSLRILTAENGRSEPETARRGAVCKSNWKLDYLPPRRHVASLEAGSRSPAGPLKLPEAAARPVRKNGALSSCTAARPSYSRCRVRRAEYPGHLRLLCASRGRSRRARGCLL